MIINHGDERSLYDGTKHVLDNPWLWYCLWGASQGFVTAVSAYRGEGIELISSNDGVVVGNYTAMTNPVAPVSGGNFEFCQGEVIDSIQLTRVVQSVWNIDANHTVMWGASHGGCVTERAVESGVQVTTAAAFSAPTDLYNWYQYCPPNSSPPSACSKLANVQGDLGAALGQISAPAFPVSPTQTRIPYDWRSPASFAADLGARKDVSMLLVQGNDDALVEPAQACELANNAWGSSGTSYYFPLNTLGSPPTVSNAANNGPPPGGADMGKIYNVAHTGCDQATFPSLNWGSATAHAVNWSKGTHYLLVYGGVDHNNESVSSGHIGVINAFGSSPSWVDFVSWLKAVGP
jgi:hypothetical protein